MHKVKLHKVKSLNEFCFSLWACVYVHTYLICFSDWRFTNTTILKKSSKRNLDSWTKEKKCRKTAISPQNLLSLHPEANQINVLIDSLSSADNAESVLIIISNLIDICFLKAGILKHYFLALLCFIASSYQQIWGYMEVYYAIHIQYESFTCNYINLYINTVKLLLYFYIHINRN